MQVRRVRCEGCGGFARERLSFCPAPNVAYTKWLVKYVLALRRSTMNKLDEEQKKELKGQRYLFLRNQEDLSGEAARSLKKLRFEYADLGTASIMKEYLHLKIYDLPNLSTREEP